MSKECDIVKDLSVNYVDNNLRDNSKIFIEEHLKKCTECRKYVEEMTIDLQKDNNSKEKDENINLFKKINKKIKNNKKINFFLVILLVIALIYNLFVFLNYYRASKNFGMEIFLVENISENDKERIKEIIKSFEINSYEYRSKEDALNKMKENMGENAHLLSGYNGENNIFPESFIVSANEKIMKEIENNLINVDGVKKIVTSGNYNPYVLFHFELIKLFK